MITSPICSTPHDITVAIPSNAKLYQYADDTQIVLTYEKNETKQNILCDVKNTISSIETWAEKNHLCLNISKTKVLPIFTKNSAFQRMNLFKEKCKKFTFTNEAKNLGIIYTYNMSWKKHFLSLLKSSKQILYILRSFCHRYTSKSHIYLRSILVNYIIKPKIK